MSDRAAPKVKKITMRKQSSWDRKRHVRLQIEAGDMSSVTRVLNAACAFKSQYQISRARARSIDGAMEAATQIEFFNVSTLGVK